MENDIRRWMWLMESAEPMVLARLTKIAQSCGSFEKFLRKTDGEDVLYRGHYDDKTGDNSFMTDYIGHAIEYAGGAGGEGTIDAFAYEPSDVLYFTDNTFDEMRHAYQGFSDKQLAATYQDALSGNRFAANFSGRQVFAKIKKVLRGTVPYSKICGDPRVNDLIIPLMQKYARDVKGKNIIAFHGSDYGEYGGQTEYVVGDISKLHDLRAFYFKIHNKT